MAYLSLQFFETVYQIWTLPLNHIFLNSFFIGNTVLISADKHEAGFSVDRSIFFGLIFAKKLAIL